MASFEHASTFAEDLHLHLTFTKDVQNSGQLVSTHYERCRPYLFFLDENCPRQGLPKFEWSPSNIEKLFLQRHDSWFDYYYDEFGFGSDCFENMRLVDPTTFEPWPQVQVQGSPLKVASDNPTTFEPRLQVQGSPLKVASDNPNPNHEDYQQQSQQSPTCRTIKNVKIEKNKKTKDHKVKEKKVNKVKIVKLHLTNSLELSRAPKKLAKESAKNEENLAKRRKVRKFAFKSRQEIRDQLWTELLQDLESAKKEVES